MWFLCVSGLHQHVCFTWIPTILLFFSGRPQEADGSVLWTGEVVWGNQFTKGKPDECSAIQNRVFFATAMNQIISCDHQAGIQLIVFVVVAIVVVVVVAVRYSTLSNF